MKGILKHNYVTAAAVIVFAALLPLSGKKLCGIQIINANGRQVTLNVEIADTEPLRNKGLMDRKEMDQGRGMLFVFEQEQNQNFWMKNTRIPLSIAYISKDGIINEIYDMKPLDISVTYPSELPAHYALEVNRGWFEKNHIQRGCKIILHGCISQ